MTTLVIFMWAVSATAVAWVALARERAHAARAARAAHEVRGGLCVARLALDAGSESVAVHLDRAGRALDELEGVAEAPASLDLRPLLRSITAAWPGVRLITPARPLRVRAQRGALVQAVTNLIANAVEHGAPPVTVCALVRHGRAHVEVSDGGAGLPAPVPALRAREGRGPRGHGLGVAADVAARHGGMLRSAPGNGTTLVLELPAEPVWDQPAGLARESARRVSAGAPARDLPPAA